MKKTDNNQQTLEKEIQEIKKMLNNTHEIATNNKNEINLLKKTNEELTKKNENLEDQVRSLMIKNKEFEKELEKIKKDYKINSEKVLNDFELEEISQNYVLEKLKKKKSFLYRSISKLNDKLSNFLIQNNFGFNQDDFVDNKNKELFDEIRNAFIKNKNIIILDFFLEEEAFQSLNENNIGIIKDSDLLNNLSFEDIIPILKNLNSKNNKKIIDYLLQKNKMKNLNDNYNYENALTIACWKGASYETIKVLIDRGININHVNKSKWNALLIACATNKPYKTIKLLIERGINVHQLLDDKWNALLLACGNYQPYETIKILIDRGININQVNNDKWNALLLACRYNQPYETIKLLIDKGIDINKVTYNKYNALHLLCYYKNENMKIYEIFIHKKIEINKKNTEGKTPFHIACEMKLPFKILELIVILGADKNIKDDSGKTPLDYMPDSLEREYFDKQQNLKYDISQIIMKN